MIEEIKQKILNDKDFWQYIKKAKSPCYIYNLDILESVCMTVKKDIKSFHNIKFYFAMKANNNKDVLKTIKKYSDGIDVATMEEFLMAKKLNFESISCNGPSFTQENIEEIYQSKEILDFDNLDQLYQAKEIIRGKRIGLRVKHKRYLESRFGIDINHKKLEDFIVENEVVVERIHFHFGEKNLEIDIMTEIIEEINQKSYLEDVHTINIGGGFEKLILAGNLKKYLEKISEITKDYTIIIEPGKGIVNYCGFLVTTVISGVLKNNVNDVVLNTSAHNVLTWFVPRPIYTTSKSIKKIETNIYGNSCYEGDIFSKNIFYPQIKANERVVFFPVGAYGSVNNKNLHKQPNLMEYSYSSEGLNVHEKRN